MCSLVAFQTASALEALVVVCSRPNSVSPLPSRSLSYFSIFSFCTAEFYSKRVRDRDCTVPVSGSFSLSRSLAFS